MNCPFCSTHIEEFVFAREGQFRAVYNIAPIFPGHTLIVPEKHIASLLELGENEVTEMILFSRKVTAMLLKVFNAEAFDWSVQDGDIAGQSQAHLHMHIVLRYPGDLPNPGDWYPLIQQNYGEILDSALRPKLKNSETERITKKLREKAGEEGLFEF